MKEIIGEKHFFYLLDLKNNKELDNRLDEIIKAHNDINVIINNAGYNDDNLSLRMKEEQWNDVININLTSNYKIIKKIVPSMIKVKYGRIIGISSVVAFTGNKGQSNYVASKSGVIGLTKSVAKELATKNITVNAIAPGYIETDMTEKLNETNKEQLLNSIPLKRLGKADDIASMACFLLSDYAAYITGQTINVDGGMVMQ